MKTLLFKPMHHRHLLCFIFMSSVTGNLHRIFRAAMQPIDPIDVKLIVNKVFTNVCKYVKLHYFRALSRCNQLWYKYNSSTKKKCVYMKSLLCSWWAKADKKNFFDGSSKILLVLYVGFIFILNDIRYFCVRMPLLDILRLFLFLAFLK